jgi:hypothetical protein
MITNDDDLGANSLGDIKYIYERYVLSPPLINIIRRLYKYCLISTEMLRVLILPIKCLNKDYRGSMRLQKLENDGLSRSLNSIKKRTKVHVVQKEGLSHLIKFCLRLN